MVNKNKVNGSSKKKNGLEKKERPSTDPSKAGDTKATEGTSSKKEDDLSKLPKQVSARARIEELEGVLRKYKKKNLLVLLKGTPDPDSIASA